MMNVLAYIIYGVVSYYITVRVGWLCYSNGIHYIRQELHDDIMADSVNRILLLGYYLLNLGYITMMIWYWEPIKNIEQLFSSIAHNTGVILLVLGLIHYCNLAILYLMSKKY